jgi:hypothetical protein
MEHFRDGKDCWAYDPYMKKIKKKFIELYTLSSII